jgi:hypothetical protein
MDAPIPLLAPVTTATRPDQRSIFYCIYPEIIYSFVLLTDIGIKKRLVRICASFLNTPFYLLGLNKYKYLFNDLCLIPSGTDLYCCHTPLNAGNESVDRKALTE